MLEVMTFWDLAQQGGILVPLIQRDYAQGRKAEKQKRDKFLEALRDALMPEDGPPLHLDFVYGRKIAPGSGKACSGNSGSFIPIDGQQRLTTLMLLHWYAARIDAVPAEECGALKNFSYETRVSSRKFCDYLQEKEVSIPASTGDNALKKAIRNCIWYRTAWDNDPTISAMLTMIQAIHDTFGEQKGLWKKLVDGRRITFQFFDLATENFTLTDELYIKMNSRGKALTNFENFKAEFIGFLEKTYKARSLAQKYHGRLPDEYGDLLQRSETPHAEYFSFRFEREWTDLFWEYRSLENSIDEGLAGYFEFITEYCFFRNKKDAAAADFKPDTFETYFSTYSDEQNLLFLFDSLDLLCALAKSGPGTGRENLAAFFEQVFTNEEPKNNPGGKINLCRTSAASKEIPVNLFEVALPGNGALGRKEEILVFCLLHYMNTFDLSHATQELRNVLRVIRNLLSNLRSRREIVYEPEIRANDFYSYWLVFAQLLSQKDVAVALLSGNISTRGSKVTERALQEEVAKAKLFSPAHEKTRFKLEELAVFEGMIQQLDAQNNLAHLADFYTAVRDIWGETTTQERQLLAIRALVACGFEGMYNKPSTHMGDLYFFGGTGQRYWSRILAASPGEINTSEDDKAPARAKFEVLAGEALRKMLLAYTALAGTPDERLQTIIEQGLAGKHAAITGASRWRYYFLQYLAFTDSNLSYIYYAWPMEKDHSIQMLGSEKGAPLSAYHINGFAWAVCRDPLVGVWCDSGKSHLMGSKYPPLVLKDGTKMYCEEDGWYIYIDGSTGPAKSDCLKTLAVQGDGAYLLPVNDAKGDDRVAVAVDFIQKLYAGQTPPQT
ncbi:DUF262 domain-containing protein [Desulfovibrio sp. OttesenSCG-928-O18]|nr:DUF262 domain-containing protein [Desulfovibrio sp. OttesenSCG-928-O18]